MILILSLNYKIILNFTILRFVHLDLFLHVRNNFFFILYEIVCLVDFVEGCPGTSRLTPPGQISWLCHNGPSKNNKAILYFLINFNHFFQFINSIKLKIAGLLSNLRSHFLASNFFNLFARLQINNCFTCKSIIFLIKISR